jgi:hypothetical protein
VTSSAALREYAECPDRFAEIPEGSSVKRFADERICILQGPTWASVSGVSVDAGEVHALLAEVRERVPAEKEPLWWIGPSSRPPSLYDELRALGLREPRDRASLLHAVVLRHEPAMWTTFLPVAREHGAEPTRRFGPSVRAHSARAPRRSPAPKIASGSALAGVGRDPLQDPRGDRAGLLAHDRDA